MRSCAALCVYVLVAIPAHLTAQSDVVVPSARVVTFVNVRKGPSTSTPTVGELNKGEQAFLVSAFPNWYHIRLANGTEGFVSKAWTTKITSDPALSSTAGDVPFKVHFLDVGTGD